MSIWLAIATATLAAVTPLQSSTAAPGNATIAIELANARARFQHVLADHHWLRDDPAVIETARGLTRELIPSLSVRDETRGDVVNTLALIASDELGPYLATLEPHAEPTLAAAYLRARDDATFLSRAATETVNANGMITPGGDLVLEAARRGRASAAPAVAAMFATIRGPRRERVCLSAAYLPAATMPAVVASLVASLPPEAPDDIDTLCTALASRARPGRALLAQWLDRAASSIPRFVPRWYLAAAVVLAGTEQHQASERAQRTILTGATAPDDFALTLQHIGPFLPLQTASGRTFVSRLVALMPALVPALGPARLHARDPAVADEALDALSTMRFAGEPARAVLQLAGLAGVEVPNGTLRARLVSFREVSRALRTNQIGALEVDSWLEAIASVDACHAARSCLEELVRHGSERAAARAVFMLGARGLATLDEATSDALVRRLAGPATAPLVTAFAITVEGCPPRLRGAVESRLVTDDQFTPVRPFFSTFVAACAVHR